MTKVLERDTRVALVDNRYSGIRLVYGNRSMELSDDTTDSVRVYRYSDKHTMVVSYNLSGPYVGADLVDLDSMEIIADVFFDGPRSFGVLGDDWEDLPGGELAYMLHGYLAV